VLAPFPLETNRFFSGWELSEVKKGSLTGEGVGIAARSPGLSQDRPGSGFSDVNVIIGSQGHLQAGSVEKPPKLTGSKMMPSKARYIAG